MSGRRGKSPVQSVKKNKRVAVVRYKFGDGDVTMPLREAVERLDALYDKMKESGSSELREIAAEKKREAVEQIAATIIRNVDSSRGGKIAKKSNQSVAAKAKEKAVARFLQLTASGERDATEALQLMIREGHKKATLYHQTKEERRKLGRVRKRVKR